MKIVRDGVTRTVILAGRYAIKFPSTRYSWRLFLRGLLANMNERDIWRWSGVADWTGVPRNLLARVIWVCPGGWFLVMERADRILTEEEYDWDLFEAAKKSKPPISDLKPDNIGIFGSNRKIIDYGEGWTTVEFEHERRGTLGLLSIRDSNATYQAIRVKDKRCS